MLDAVKHDKRKIICESMKIWEKGFSVNDKIEKFTVGQDRELDMYLAPFDMLASKAQAKMLASIGLISKEEESQLLTGLDEYWPKSKMARFKLKRTLRMCIPKSNIT